MNKYWFGGEITKIEAKQEVIQKKVEIKKEEAVKPTYGFSQLLNPKKFYNDERVHRSHLITAEYKGAAHTIIVQCNDEGDIKCGRPVWHGYSLKVSVLTEMMIALGIQDLGELERALYPRNRCNIDDLGGHGLRGIRLHNIERIYKDSDGDDAISYGTISEHWDAYWFNRRAVKDTEVYNDDADIMCSNYIMQSFYNSKQNLIAAYGEDYITLAHESVKDIFPEADSWMVKLTLDARVEYLKDNPKYKPYDPVTGNSVSTKIKVKKAVKADE